MRKTLILAATLLAVVALSGTAMAGTATVAVSATVVGTCKVTTSSGSIVFGNLNPDTGADPAVGTVTPPVIWCTNGATYSITAASPNKVGSQFNMISGTELLPYSFTFGTPGVGAGPNTPITLGLAGSVAKSAYSVATAGVYSDTVTLTITP